MLPLRRRPVVAVKLSYCIGGGSMREREGTPSTMSSDDEDQRVALVYEDALRAVEYQHAVLDNIRARTGTLLSAASLSTAFLGAQALKGSSIGGAAWSAIGSLSIIFAASLWILWPRSWVFHRSAREMLRQYVDHDQPFSLAHMQRDLSLHFGEPLPVKRTYLRPNDVGIRGRLHSSRHRNSRVC
jgi:hypothetical protein